ncbi:MAG: hypothetical protein CIT01_10495 [Methanobacterium sp. BRmetb2]|nr:MAG: hypothetical protein CIT01_10495 [Methanobacterium sp. BRmetb2]
MRKVPLLNHPEYVIDYVNDVNILNIIYTLMTGTVQTPIIHLTSGSISRNGSAQGFEGPGMLVVRGNKLIVDPPTNFIWGYKTPTAYAVKTSSGIDIYENNNKISSVAYDYISNDTVPHDFVDIKYLKQWYKYANEGDKINIIFQLSNFNDGRNTVPPNKIKTYFGTEVFQYMVRYPEGNPIMVYKNSYTEEVIASSASYLGSYPEYGDYTRAYNAKTFSYGWNGTIIPPATSSSGKERVGLASVKDPEAPGGYATHGTCPPARALRDVVLIAGFPMPKGMTGEHNAVIYGYSPSSGIKVTNTGDYPVQIRMWTRGSGANTVIYAEMIQLVPT